MLAVFGEMAGFELVCACLYELVLQAVKSFAVWNLWVVFLYSMQSRQFLKE